MSLSGIIALLVIGLIVVFLVSVRVEVAKQRRAVETARARLAAAKVRRRAEGVPVEVVLQTGSAMTHIARKSICALAEDGLYCLSGDGALAAAPVLIKGGKAVDTILPAWLAAGLASLPPDGVLLQLQIGLSWLIAVPDADEWFAALTASLPGARAAATT